MTHQTTCRITYVLGMPSFAQDFLEEAPMSWDALVKKTFRKKEEILPMQMAEVRCICRYALQAQHPAN